MPICACTDIEIRTGTVTINNGSGDLNVGNVQLINYGRLEEKHPIINPIYNVVDCVKEYVNGQYAVVTLDCSKWEIFDYLLGITATVNVPANPPLPTGVAGMIGPVGIDNVIYLDDANQLGDAYHGPYAALSFEIASGCPGPALVEGLDYQFGDTDGGFIVSEADPAGINGTYIYICAGTYTTAASQEYRFDECAINTSMSFKYEHPMQDHCPSTNNFTIWMPDAYIVEAIDITDAPGEPRLYTVRFESIWHPGSADYELGYWKFETA